MHVLEIAFIARAVELLEIIGFTFLIQVHEITFMVKLRLLSHV